MHIWRCTRPCIGTSEAVLAKYVSAGGMQIVSLLLKHHRSLHLTSPRERKLPLSLVAEAVYEQSGGNNPLNCPKYNYTPKPGFAFCRNGFPRVLVKFDSARKDKERMLCQLACITRLDAECHPHRHHAGDIFLMGVYFSKQFGIERFFFFFLDGKVSNNACRFFTILTVSYDLL